MDKETKIGWDLHSVKSVPLPGQREYFDRIELKLRKRSTGEIESAVITNHSPWMAICFAFKEITGIQVDDQPFSHESLLSFVSAAMVDVNRKIKDQESEKAKTA